MKVKQVICPGVYLMDNGSYRVVARIGDRSTGRPREKRFPKGTPIRTMKGWLEEQRSELRRTTLRVVRGTLAADSETYLARVAGRLRHPQHRTHEIAAWLPTFGHRRRDSIRDHEISRLVDEWQAGGVAASTIRHRLSALSGLYRTLDGRGGYNPVVTVERPAEPKPGANAVPLEHVAKVFDALERRVLANNRGRKTLARLRVISETGMRHSQVMRLKPQDIWLDHDPPLVMVNQPGKNGRAHSKPLSAQGVAAFREFIACDAFGQFSQSSVYKSWRIACEDAGVPFFNPYRLRHTWATALRAGGMDLADVQELIGHTSAKTTARYAAVDPEKLASARSVLDRAQIRARQNVEQENSGDIVEQTGTKRG